MKLHVAPGRSERGPASSPQNQPRDAISAPPHPLLLKVRWDREPQCLRRCRGRGDLGAAGSKEFTSRKPLQLIEVGDGNCAVPIDWLPVDLFFFSRAINESFIEF